MPDYTVPGIYIEEMSGPRPIQAVGTSTAGFVGVTPDPDKYKDEVQLISSWTQFVSAYVPPSSKSLDNNVLAHAIYGFFANGGQRCYVVNVGRNESKAPNPITRQAPSRTGLALLEAIDDVAIVLAPGYTTSADYDALIEHCEPKNTDEQRRYRVAILDCVPEATPQSFQIEAQPAQNQEQPAQNQEQPAQNQEQPAQNQEQPPAQPSAPAPDAAQRRKPVPTWQRPRTSDSGAATCYFPWIEVRDPLNFSQVSVIPPSGHIAGIWSRTDALRGVHKAPANEIIAGATGVRYRLIPNEIGSLNEGGINCIREFSDGGIRVWGARTLASPDSSWRYLNVRRLFNMIEQSIAESTRWIVFEPNDFTLWKSIRRDVGAFLTLVWRDGALMGRTPEEAFFVKCDRETNTDERIGRGIVVAQIGIAPVKPAEFIVFRLMQSESGAEVTSGGGGMNV